MRSIYKSCACAHAHSLEGALDMIREDAEEIAGDWTVWTVEQLSSVVIDVYLTTHIIGDRHIWATASDNRHLG